MPRRPAIQNVVSPPPPDPAIENYAVLRKQWKWAAFCEFFYVFAPLFALPDVAINDIENDLTHSTNIVLPRVMHRLLFTLSYDRKISLSNWQTALRKQYNRRDPSANPIGPEPGRSDPADDHAEASMNADPDATNADGSLVMEDGPARDGTPSSRQVSCQPSIGRNSVQPRTETRQNSTAADDDVPSGPSLNWTELPMLIKLESMHTLAEWHFHNPTRLRTIMKNDDELASWRSEPIGYDSKSNAYWFIGGSRLWIQRSPPKPPKQLKRKRQPAKKPQKRETKAPTTPAKRARTEVASRSKKQPEPTSVIASPSGRRSRAAKEQANLKLDAQARALAELNRQAKQTTAPMKETRSTRAAASRVQPARAPRASLGTRTSARLRGTATSEEEEDWQPIPKDWLEGKDSPKKKPTTGLESDDESDLTELSDDSAEEQAPSPHDEEQQDEEEAEEEEDPAKAEEEPSQPTDFVEWETLCTTLEEWEHIAERFEGATHYTEKALYKVLTKDVVPFVVEELREKQKKQQLEEAVNHRKRSSRLAIKESEREEARMVAQRQHEEEEKQSRAKRMEARHQREEMDRLRREQAREQRRLEREAREQSRHAKTETPEPIEPTPPVEEKPTNGVTHTVPKNGTHKKRGRPAHEKRREEWELACEVCQRQATNPNDDSPVVSCGQCGKWQHIECHDRMDQAAGRPPRNWDKTEFLCRQCRMQGRYPPAPLDPRYSYSSQSYKQHQPVAPYGHPIPPYNYPSRDPTLPGYYSAQATNGGFPPIQSHYQQPPPPPIPRPSHSQRDISFNHYQPAERNFMSTQKMYQDHAQPYGQPQSSHYNQQPYNGGASYAPIKQQTLQPTWNPPPPGYSSHPVTLQHPSSHTPYRPPPPSDNQSYHHHPVNGLASGYGAQSQYPPTQYRPQGPSSYQMPVDRP